MWDENKVTKWMSSIGYSSFEKQFRGKKKKKKKIRKFSVFILNAHF